MACGEIGMKNPCGGQHELLTILQRSEGFDTYAVVRWCERCGAIVVDLDTDNRTFAGRMLEMRLPQISQGKDKID